jgi:hypothetical protein
MTINTGRRITDFNKGQFCDEVGTFNEERPRNEELEERCGEFFEVSAVRFINALEKFHDGGAAVQFHDGAEVQFHDGAEVQFHDGAVVQFHDGAEVQFHDGAEVQFPLGGAAVQFHDGAEVQLT